MSRKEYYRDWYAKNRERRIEAARRWHAENPEKAADIHRKWRASNNAKIAKRTMEWRAVNRGRAAAQVAKYRATKRNATPPWADMGAIDAVYDEAARMGMTVDHIVPLKNKNVCGLHVHWNLQLLTLADNSRKWNRFDETLALAA